MIPKYLKDSCSPSSMFSAWNQSQRENSLAQLARVGPDPARVVPQLWSQHPGGTGREKGICVAEPVPDGRRSRIRILTSFFPQNKPLCKSSDFNINQLLFYKVELGGLLYFFKKNHSKICIISNRLRW